MNEILTGATFLILIVMLLRCLTGGRISMRFRYGLWLIVMIRLIVPVSFGNSPFSVLNLAWRWPEEMVKDAETVLAGGSSFRLQSDEVTGNVRPSEAAGTVGDRGESAAAGARRQEMTDQSETPDPGEGSGGSVVRDIYRAGLAHSKQLRLLIRVIWIAGILAVGGYMLAGRLRFGCYLHRMGTEVPAEELPDAWGRRLGARNMHVYQTAGLPGPCLVGRSIYIGPQLLMDQDKLSHVLAHEYAHALQGDALWSFVRSVLCAVYWFWPFVWIAAYEAKRDSELACDERAIMLLGEAQRFAYGRTLLDLLSVWAERTGYSGTVLNMGGREKHVKERIFMIAGKRRNSKTAAVLVILAAMITCGCAFTGAATAGTGKTILLTNEGSLGNGNASSDSREVTEGRTKEQPEETQDIQSRQAEQEEDRLRQETEKIRQEEDRLRREAEEIREEALGAEHAAFQQVLDRMADSDLASAEPLDLAAYYNYLFKEAEFPMQDGKWYQLSQKEETGIDFYGLYTKDYGFRGLEIRIGDDVNTFDQPWLPTLFQIDTLVLEESEEDGMPRSFAFEMCVVNTNTTERHQLYVADRYDTGAIDLHPFREEDCREQMKDQEIALRVDQNTATVVLAGEGEEAAVDISLYRDDEVEEAVWDDGLTGYRLEDGQITFITGIGLKVAGSDELRYHGLPLIDFPVEVGSFGERSFTLGRPYVDEKFFSARLNR